MKLEFLPAYSPDFNPIELAFSAIKAYVRRHFHQFSRSNATGTELEDKAAVYTMLHEAVFSITQSNAQSFFHHCGYL